MKNNKKTCFDGKETETKPSMCGKIKPVLKKRGSEIPRQKQPPNVLFPSSPNSTCRSFSRQHEKTMGIK
jgi:hypothetical protein